MAKATQKKRKPAPKDETKEERFIRVASMRVAKAVKAIGNIAHCASSNYAFNPKQVQDICNALTTATEQTLDAFSKNKVESVGFRFTETG